MRRIFISLLAAALLAFGLAGPALAACGSSTTTTILGLYKITGARGWWECLDDNADTLDAYVSDNLESGTAESGASTTLTDSDKNWATDIWAGNAVRITGGTGVGQVRKIDSNTATQLTVSTSWSTNPDSTSAYEILRSLTNTVESFTKAALPAAGTAGRLARVTDNVRGVWMDTGSRWTSLAHEEVSATEFGAVCDGVTDDSAAIQAAVDALGSTGGDVRLPRGACAIASPLKFTSGQGLVGCGIDCSTLKDNTTSGPAIQVHTSGSVDPAQRDREYYLRFEDFTLAKGTGSSTIGLHLVAVNHSSIRRVLVEDYTAGSGIKLQSGQKVNEIGSYFNLFEEVRLRNNNIGLEITAGGAANGPNENTVLGGGIIDSVTYGVKIDGATENLRFVGVNFTNNADHVYQDSTLGPHLWQANRFEGGGAGSIILTANSTRNWFEGNACVSDTVSDSGADNSVIGLCMGDGHGHFRGGFKFSVPSASSDYPLAVESDAGSLLSYFDKSGQLFLRPSVAGGGLSLKSTTGGVALTLDKDAIGSQAYLGIKTASATKWRLGAISSDDFSIDDGTVGNTRFRIESGGLVRVGIGATFGLVNGADDLGVEGDFEVDGLAQFDGGLTVPDGQYAQIGELSAGAPTAADCDADGERFRVALDTTNHRLYICNGATRLWDYVALTD